MQHSSEPGWYFRFPASHHSTPHLQSIDHRTVLHDVQCLCIRQQARDVVQIRAVCCVTWSQRILPDLNVLRARCSHQLTQSRCHRRTVCSHFERPCCPSFLTIILARIHVWFRQEFRVNQAQTSSHLGLCRRSSLCCQLLCHCIKLRSLQRYQVFQLLDLFCCCPDSAATLPATIVSPVARSSETAPQPQPQVRTNAPLPCTTRVRKDKGKQQCRQTTR